MARSSLGSADNRPRIYVRQTMDGRFSWRCGLGGEEKGGFQSPGAAANEAIENNGRVPAVIFWEGPTHG